MSLRDFTDASGRVWQVWNTTPSRAAGASLFPIDPRGVGAPEPPGATSGELIPYGHVSPGLEHGWLTFKAGDEKRRLSPIPPDWTAASDAELAGYLSRAVPVHLSAAAAQILKRAEPA